MNSYGTRSITVPLLPKPQLLLCPRVTIQKRLCPLLPDFIETSLFKIIRSHDHPKFNICVESEEPGFSKGGNL